MTADVEINASALLSRLSQYLPRSANPYRILNLLSSCQSIPLVYKPKQEKPIVTTKSTHFILLFSPTNVPLIALEILVYCTVPHSNDCIERLVYISKADTSGLEGCTEVNVGCIVKEILSWICQLSIKSVIKNVKFKNENSEKTQFPPIGKGKGPFSSRTHWGLHVLVERAKGNTNYGVSNIESLYYGLEGLIKLGVNEQCLTHVITKIILFTRAEGQYLFPESSRNKNKHILSDKELLKWWLKNVEEVAKLSFEKNTTRKWLNVLSAEKRDILRYIPVGATGWNVGNVFDGENKNKGPAVCWIPLLPDDPKGRFLEHLVIEGRVKKVGMIQFWEELAIRQEFRLGVVVGLIGIEGIAKTGADAEENVCFVTKNILKEVLSLVMGTDYSDETDWKKLWKEINNLEQTSTFNIYGSKEKVAKRKIIALDKPAVNNLLCRSRKKQKRI